MLSFSYRVSDALLHYLSLFITGRNEVLAKVIFLHLSVILFTGGGAPDIALSWGGAPDFALILGGFLQILGGFLQIFGGGYFLGEGGPPKFSGVEGFSTGIRSTFDRYASYWNAFLLHLLLITVMNNSVGYHSSHLTQ